MKILVATVLVVLTAACWLLSSSVVQFAWLLIGTSICFSALTYILWLSLGKPDSILGELESLWLKLPQGRRWVGLSKVDRMIGHRFEHYVSKLMENEGYSVRVTPASGDRGADIIAKRGSRKYAVQVKRSNQKVGSKAIAEVFTASRLYGCDRAMVVTNSHFTKRAKKDARDLGCELVDRTTLRLWVERLRTAEGKPSRDTLGSILKAVLYPTARLAAWWGKVRRRMAGRLNRAPMPMRETAGPCIQCGARVEVKLPLGTKFLCRNCGTAMRLTDDGFKRA